MPQVLPNQSEFQNNHSSTIEDICSVCEAAPEDMLILTCKHNLCLDCATQIYQLNQGKQNTLTCQICLKETKLDMDTIVCLRSLLAKNFQEKIIINDQYERQNYSNFKKYPPISSSKQEEYNFSDNHSQKPLKRTQNDHSARSEALLYCSKHSQPIVYFCFDCNNYKICSECMVSQNHRDHKVLTLKKSTLIIKQTIQKISREKLRLKNLLQNDHQNLTLRKEQSEKQHQRNLLNLKQSFDSFIIQVTTKYNEMKEKLDSQSFRKLQIMQGAINQIGSKVLLINETLEFQEQLLAVSLQANNQSPYRIFQYYTNEFNNPGNVNFEPNLPSFIPQIRQQLLNGEAVFQNLKMVLQKVKFLSSEQKQYGDDSNINYISHIGHQQQNLKDITLQQPNHRQFIFQAESKPFRVPNFPSQNINIVTRVPLKLTPSILKQGQRKKRQLKDKQLAKSRKQQLSKSLSNAAQIISKLQQRTRI